MYGIVVVHPECPYETLRLADQVGSVSRPHGLSHDSAKLAPVLQALCRA